MNTALPNEMTLKSSPYKWTAVLLVCSLFTWGAVWMLPTTEDKLIIWLGLILFAVLGVPISLLQLIKPGSLTLNADGFEQKMMGRTMGSTWHNVSDFGVMRVGKTKMVSFSRLEDEGKKMGNLSKVMTGGHSGALGDTFGMKAHELADIMNAFRNRALRG